MSAGLEVAAVSARGLVKRFPDVVAVNGLDLTIHRGECFGLLGPNGAGKTTTVEMLEGLGEPDEGTVEIFGERWGKDDRALRQRIGVALQETRLGEKLTVAETLRLFRSFYRRGVPVNEVIEDLELGEKRDAYVGKLSGGQKQRLALGCALVGAPDILFLDEPTTGLDPQARRKVWELVERFKAKGGTLCLTTHYMEEAERLCDRIGVVDHGKLIALGTPEELVQRLEAPALVEVSVGSEIAIDRWSALPGVKSARKHEELVMLTTADPAALLPTIMRWLEAEKIELKSVSTRKATLEDVFLHLTGRGLRDG
ncbi:MAG: ABC transporter ATP-binding protein [Myxococcota bacterium]